MKQVEVAIIGAGPAGIAAAIQLKRSGFDPILLEKNSVGGLLRNANLVENYPGFPGGIGGSNLVELFARQLDETGVAVCKEKVETVRPCQDGFELKTDKRVVVCSHLVVASGTKSKHMTEPHVPEALRFRVFSEVHQLTEVEGCDIAIIGGGDAAFDYAINLARKNSVTIINRSGEAKCLPLLWSRCESCAEIKYIANTTVAEIRECDGRMRLNCRGSHNKSLMADYLLTAIGREPQVHFLPAETDPAAAQAEYANLHFIGDVVNGRFRQVSISVGDGVRAAMDICRRARGL